jgi:hypothetical protein
MINGSAAIAVFLFVIPFDIALPQNLPDEENLQRSQMSQRRSSPVRPVCDVLAHASEVRGQLLSVRGRYEETEEGIYLFGDCKTRLSISGFVWPQEFYALFLIPQSSSLAEKPNSSSRAFVDSRLAPLLKNLKNTDRLWVTVTGRVESRKSFEIVEWGNGQKRPVGYGHLSLYPAQIAYERIEDPVVVPNK